MTLSDWLWLAACIGLPTVFYGLAFAAVGARSLAITTAICGPALYGMVVLITYLKWGSLTP